MTYEFDLAINYCTFNNFKQKAAYIVNSLFAQGRINDYMHFKSYGIITPLDDKNKHISIEEIDKFNRIRTNCIIYDLTYNKWNPGKYDKCFIYFSNVTRDTNWYGYVLYNSETGDLKHKYCIKYEDDKLYQYIYRSIISLADDVKWDYYNKEFDSLKNRDTQNYRTINHYKEYKQYYEDFIKKPFTKLDF